jgi:hypothetical protein
MTTPHQQQEERDAFDRFVSIGGLAVVISSIRLGDVQKSEPDVVCTVDGLGEVGFELTEIVENDFMQTRSIWQKVDQTLRDELQKLPPPTLAAFQAKYANADIGVSFDHKQTEKTMIAAIPSVLTLLHSLPSGVVGAIEASNLTGGIVDKIRITRLSASLGPVIYAQHPGGWLGDVTAHRIGNKLGKNYSASPVRRELIAYFRTQPPALADLRDDALDQLIAGRLTLDLSQDSGFLTFGARRLTVSTRPEIQSANGAADRNCVMASSAQRHCCE